MPRSHPFRRRVRHSLASTFAIACLASTWAEAPSQAGTPATKAPAGQVMFDKLKTLEGTWDAPLADRTMTDTFKPFAFGSAILAEEWIDGKQITSTVFYVVNGELRMDHYCDYLNQPRYAAVPSADPQSFDFQFRDAANLDTHPVHFHGTKWRMVDATHLTQDWFVMGGTKSGTVVHMEFTRRPVG